METVNLVMAIVGAIVILFGIGAFINPNVARWINAPGGPRLKAVIALITGIIIVLVSLLVEIPTS